MIFKHRTLVALFCSATLAAGCGGSSTPGGSSGHDGGAGTGSGGAAGTAGTGAGGGAAGVPGGGGTSGAGGLGGAAGVGGADAGSNICGTIAGITCGAGEWCDYQQSASGTNYCGGDDGGGVCRQKPQGCTADCPGVCGCDGKFYCNACQAHAAGTDDTNDTSCMHTGDAGSGVACQSDNDCQNGLKCCYPCGTSGCSNQCMKPDSNGQCPAFP